MNTITPEINTDIKRGIYKEIMENGAITERQIARRIGCNPKYVNNFLLTRPDLYMQKLKNKKEHNRKKYKALYEQAEALKSQGFDKQEVADRIGFSKKYVYKFKDLYEQHC